MNITWLDVLIWLWRMKQLMERISPLELELDEDDILVYENLRNELIKINFSWLDNNTKDLLLNI